MGLSVCVSLSMCWFVIKESLWMSVGEIARERLKLREIRDEK
jgi:hypothetical protein